MTQKQVEEYQQLCTQMERDSSQIGMRTITSHVTHFAKDVRQDWLAYWQNVVHIANNRYGPPVLECDPHRELSAEEKAMISESVNQEWDAYLAGITVGLQRRCSLEEEGTKVLMPVRSEAKCILEHDSPKALMPIAPEKEYLSAKEPPKVTMPDYPVQDWQENGYERYRKEAHLETGDVHLFPGEDSISYLDHRKRALEIKSRGLQAMVSMFRQL